MERIFNAYKIKYDILNRHLLPIRASRKVNTINIYINIDDFYHKLHREDTDKEFQVTGQNASKQVVSNLINLAAHYKHWAIKENLSPNIYMIYTSSKIFRNAMTLPAYREYYNKITMIENPKFFYVNNTMINAISILQVITKYIPHVYAIDSNYIEPSLIPFYISDLNPADLNLLISRDEYDLQYVQFDKWAIIIPKGELSPIINKGNLWDYIRYKYKIEKEFHYHPESYVWAKAIIGDKYRSIPKLTRTSWKTVVKYLDEYSSMKDTIEILELQLKKLAEFITSKKIIDTDFNNNLYCTSVLQQYNGMMDVDKIMIRQQLTDMEDMKSLYQANNNLFKAFPINLPFLLQEKSISRSQPHNEYTWMQKGRI